MRHLPNSIALRKLDPLTLFVGVTAAWPLHYRGQYDAAAKQIERMLDMYPKDIGLLSYLHQLRAESFLERGMERQAVDEYLQSESFGGASPEAIAALRSSYETSGMKGYWQKSVDLEEEKHRKEIEQVGGAGKYVTSVPLAKLYARREPAVPQSGIHPRRFSMARDSIRSAIHQPTTPYGAGGLSNRVL